MKRIRLAVTMLGLAVGAAGQARAAITLDFESLPTSPSGGVRTGTPLVLDGARLSSVPGGDFSAFADGWQSNRGSSNGTTTLGVYSPSSFGPPSSPASPDVAFSLSMIDGGTFDLVSIDVAELLKRGDSSFGSVARTVEFSGELSGGGTVDRSFTLDLISDSVGGVVDFETVLLGPDFSNLLSVTVTASSGTRTTSLNIDNIVVNTGIAAVPEPSTLAGGIVGIALLGGAWLRRRKPRAA